MAIADDGREGWKAWEDRMPGSGGPTLHVTGSVETTNGNQTPHLNEAKPQGINPKVLILDLTITVKGVGPDVMGHKEVHFTKKVTPGEHTSVDIHRGGSSIAVVPVEIVQ